MAERAGGYRSRGGSADLDRVARAGPAGSDAAAAGSAIEGAREKSLNGSPRQAKLEQNARSLGRSPRLAQLRAIGGRLNSGGPRPGAASAEHGPVAQLVPTLPIQMPDEDFVELLTSGALAPATCTITDERTREGATQQLSMLTYEHQGHRADVHIHIAEGTFFGHVDMRGGQRLGLTAEQSEAILGHAEASGVEMNYRDPPKHARYETGDFGHEGKGRKPL